MRCTCATSQLPSTAAQTLLILTNGASTSSHSTVRTLDRLFLVLAELHAERPLHRLQAGLRDLIAVAERDDAVTGLAAKRADRQRLNTHNPERSANAAQDRGNDLSCSLKVAGRFG